MLNELRAYNRAMAGIRFIVAATAARARPTKELAEERAAHTARAFPVPLEVRSFPNATFIHEVGNDSPLACLTGDDHEEKGRALVSAVSLATEINLNSLLIDLL